MTACRLAGLQAMGGPTLVALQSMGGPTQKKKQKNSSQGCIVLREVIGVFSDNIRRSLYHTRNIGVYIPPQIATLTIHQGQMKLVWVLKIGIIKIFLCHIPIFPSTRIVPKISKIITRRRSIGIIPIISSSFAPRVFFTHC